MVISYGFIHDLGIFIWYQIEKDYFTEVLCVERNMIDSKCDGHCALSEHFSEQDASNEKSNNELILESNVQLMINQYQVVASPSIKFLILLLPPQINTKPNYSSHLTEVFHPPPLV